MYYTGLTVILLAVAVGFGSCNTCAYPTMSDIETVIENILEFDHVEGDVNVQISILHPVCLAVGNVPNRYRAVSVWVRYTCSGDVEICPGGTVEEQIESECEGGVWSVVGDDPEDTRTVNPTAKYATTTKRNCFNCVSPERAVGFDPDGTTHCLREHIDRHRLYICIQFFFHSM